MSPLLQANLKKQLWCVWPASQFFFLMQPSETQEMEWKKNNNKKRRAHTELESTF